MSLIITALMTGCLPEPVAGASPTRLGSSLGSAIGQISDLCTAAGGSLRLLAGVGGAGTVQYEAAILAAAQGLALHLLSPGQPSPLTEHQSMAQRQVWLGAQATELASGEPQDICDEIALGFADVLLVAWDAPESGAPDRTARIIVAAALAMKPVIWVDWSGAVRVLDRVKLTRAQRHLLQCSHPSFQALLACFCEPLDAAGIQAHLRLISGALSVAASDDAAQPTSTGSSRSGMVHNVLMALVQGKPAKALRALAARPITAYRGPAWSASQDLIAPTAVLDAQFDRADVKATVAAGKHRSAVWLSSVASTMAVFAAVAGAIHLWTHEHGLFWAVLELVLVLLVIGLLWRARQQQWHSRWIANRFVAEQLRYARMGLPLLAHNKSLFESASCVMPDAAGVARLQVLSPDLQTLQKTLTRLGLPMPAAGGPFVAATADSLPFLRDYVLAVVHDQIAYHERVRHEQHATEHVLHRLSLLLFCLTGVAVVGHFVLHASWLLIFTAFFPALAAGIHGLSTSLEISRIAEQSKATASDLRQLALAMRMAVGNPGSAWRRWVQLRHLTLLAAELMSDENDQWQKLVTHQKPKLPA